MQDIGNLSIENIEKLKYKVHDYSEKMILLNFIIFHFFHRYYNQCTHTHSSICLKLVYRVCVPSRRAGGATINKNVWRNQLKIVELKSGIALIGINGQYSACSGRNIVTRQDNISDVYTNFRVSVWLKFWRIIKNLIWKSIFGEIKYMFLAIKFF